MGPLPQRLRSPSVAIGGALVAFWIIIAVAAPAVAPFPPNATLQPFALPGAEFAGGQRFWLGTDQIGRDIASRLIWGARTVLLWAPIATLAAYAAGIPLGLLAGSRGGAIDAAVMFATNVLLSFPVLVLYILIIGTIGASPLNLVIAVVFAGAPGIVRLVRALAARERTRDYVAAAYTRGEGVLGVMVLEILPNIAPTLIADACLRLGYVIVTLGVLGFLGLGLPPPDPDWGGMINEARPVALAFPHIAVAPCLALVSLVLGCNLLADGLRDDRR
ncbi:MAG: ABC transporter permease [Rhodospirillales bacterium]|jgi:peptide/nickel transport system permease protein|nr:ABC transporter permease [Rhodospirillales bacterium]